MKAREKIMASEYEIKEFADELCKKYAGIHITQIRDRNECIIKELMSKYDISYEYAKACFENNKNRQPKGNNEEYQHLSEKRKQRVQAMFKGYKN